MAPNTYFRETGWRFEIVEDLAEEERARQAIPGERRPDRLWRTKAEWRDSLTRISLPDPPEGGLGDLDVGDDVPLRLVRCQYLHPNADPEAAPKRTT